MAQEKQSTYMVGKDMFLLPDGSTYHLGVKAGDLFPRILTVGEKSRAQLIATLFDSDKPVKAISSKREFHIFSGYYKGRGLRSHRWYCTDLRLFCDVMFFRCGCFYHRYWYGHPNDGFHDA